MVYTTPITTTPLVGKNWTLNFGWYQSTGGVRDNGMSTNFTCASAIMWSLNFTSNDKKINAYSHMGPSPVPEKERYELYDQLVKRFSVNTFMVQLVGVVNGGTAGRLKHYLSSENKHGYHTYDFVNYLITKKVGVVVESPVFVNTYHKWEGPSICQAWFWFSPSIIEQGALLEHTGGIHGLENVTKFLPDSEINKTNVGSFSDMLAKPLVDQPRFAKASETWDNALREKGFLKVPDVNENKVPKYGELFRRKMV